MSKVNALRRKAVDAVRSQKWDEAIKLYERICGADTNNASYRNELGDIYLKKGEIPSAIQAFESAAELYVSFGLTNNAVAVHKKILRHDPGNLDSLWGLGEIRRQQGLEADASTHFQNFLQHADLVSDHSRRKFLQRCAQLLELEAGDLQVLSGLESIYRDWNLPEENARVLLIKAQLAKESGELDMVDKYVDHARQLLPEVETLPEYGVLMGRPSAPTPPVTDEASLDLRDPASSSAVIDLTGVQAAPPARSGATPSVDPSVIDLDLGFDLGGDDADILADDDLAIELDEGDAEASFVDASPDEDEVPEPAAPKSEFLSTREEFMRPSAPQAPLEPEPRASGPLETTPPASEASPAANAGDAQAAAPAPAAPASGPTPPAPTNGGVDLLAEILADSGIDLTESDEKQVNSIASGVAGQIASQVAADDYKGQYEVGLVYLDMGLYDQAADAFGRAALGDDQRLKALEMQGNCLTRLGRYDEAMRALQAGLSTPGYPSRFYLGLLYEAGVCQEALGRADEARDYFLRVASVDGEFLDVVERLAQLDASRA